MTTARLTWRLICEFQQSFLFFWHILLFKNTKKSELPELQHKVPVIKQVFPSLYKSPFSGHQLGSKRSPVRLAVHLPSTAHTEVVTQRSRTALVVRMAAVTPLWFPPIIRLSQEQQQSHRNTVYSSVGQSHLSAQSEMHTGTVRAARRGTEADYRRWSVALSSRCFSHLPSQSEESTADRKPITRAFLPDPSGMPNGTAILRPLNA